MARQSEEHSFLPGASLWADTKTFRPVTACAGDSPDAGKASAACTTFLDQNLRAREQWRLEREFAVFEKQAAALPIAKAQSPDHGRQPGELIDLVPEGTLEIH